jgi:malonyl-CoA O-methyltransferase
MTAPAQFVDSRQVRRSFSRAASGYEAVASVPREISSRMLARLDYVKIEPACVLDLGCATGASLTALSERYPKALAVGADFSLAMLQAGRAQRSPLRWLMPFLRGKQSALVAADAAQLPFAADSIGLLWSNLLLHWLDDPLTALREMHRVLDVGGLLMFSTLGPDTLKELRACFSDDDAHTQRFADMHDYGDMLIECGYADPVMDVETLTLTYAGVDELFADLRQHGATCAMLTRRRGLMGRATWHSVCQRYEQLKVSGRLPATFEIVYGHAWKAQPKKAAEAGAIIRFDPKQRLR